MEEVDVMSGGGYASDPEEFLTKFNSEVRSLKEEDSFGVKKFNTSSLAVYTGNRSGKDKYISPTGADGAKSKAVNQEFNSYDLYGVAEPPYNLAKLVQISEKSVPHYAAVDAKVSNITRLGYDFIESDSTRDKLSDKDGDAKRKAQAKVARTKRDIKKWLKTLNDEDSIDEVLEKVMFDYYYTGNAYIEIGRKVSGSVGYIGHVPAITVRVRKARDGYIQIVGDKATYFRPFGKDHPNPLGGDKAPNEMIHIKKYSPLSGYYGVPEIVVALMSVAGTELAQKYNLDYFHNKATPRYVIVLKGGNLSEANQRRVAEFFETGVKASNHRSLYVPLPADTSESKVSFEMKPIEAGVQEASFEKYIKMNNNFILMTHRVPVSKVGLAEGVSLAVARDADKTFNEQVVRPMQSRLEEKINKIIQSDGSNMFDFKFNELSLSDEDTQSKIDERYARNKIHTPNEIRARRGYPSVPGGDEMVELSARGAADARANTQQNRSRDAERSAGATDSVGEGRNEQGAGPSTD